MYKENLSARRRDMMPSDRTIRRNNLWRLALYGALFSVAVRAISTENFFPPSTAAGMARFIGYLLPGIIIFVVIGELRERIADLEPRPQRDSDQPRESNDDSAAASDRQELWSRGAAVQHEYLKRAKGHRTDQVGTGDDSARARGNCQPCRHSGE